MANPFGSETVDDYGTLSGRSRGFRTRDGDIDDLRRKIGDTVIQIKQDTNSIQSMGARLGTSSDSDDLRNRIQNTFKGTMEKVEHCRSLLKELAQLSRESDDRGMQLTVKSVQQNLTAATNNFQHISQEIYEKMRSCPVPSRLDTPTRVDLDDDSDRARLVPHTSSLEAQKQSFVVSSEVAHIEERARRMGDLESDIRQLNEVMQDIGKLVVTQGEAVDMIEKNVDDVAINVDEGNKSLEKGVTYKKCSRRLQCIIIAIVIAVLIIIAIVATIIGCQTSHKC